MNAFYKHHQDNIRFNYRCFDRILLNGLIQPFQQPERVIGFFDTYRQLYPVSRDVLRDIAGQFQNWVQNRSRKWAAPILEAPQGRRDEFIAPYFRKAKPDQVVAILKAREPARILIAIGNKKDNRWHLEIAQRWVIQYNFYVNDRSWGRMFVRLCPYFPFSARVCLNQHYWLANQMREQGIDFQQCANAFLKCGDPKRLQELADSLTARDLLLCGQKWLTRFTPFFTARERQQAGCQHRLFFAQVEYCDNLIFHRRAALDALGERLGREGRGFHAASARDKATLRSATAKGRPNHPASAMLGFFIASISLGLAMLATIKTKPHYLEARFLRRPRRAFNSTMQRSDETFAWRMVVASAHPRRASSPCSEELVASRGIFQLAKSGIMKISLGQFQSFPTQLPVYEGVSRPYPGGTVRHPDRARALRRGVSLRSRTQSLRFDLWSRLRPSM